MGTGGRWRPGGSCEAWEGLLSLSLSLVGAGLMLKPVDRSDDDEEEEEVNDSVGILKVFDPLLKRISLV